MTNRTEHGPRSGKPVTEEALAYFGDVIASMEQGEGCWEWPRTLTSRGYGLLYTTPKAGGNFLAHRVSYTAARGPIPAGLVLDHLCRNPACINPEHLEAVTQRENLLRGDTGSAGWTSTHCRNGHLLTEANLRITYRGARLCLACRRERETRDREARARDGRSRRPHRVRES